MADKIYRYWIAVPSGLEAVALDELHESRSRGAAG